MIENNKNRVAAGKPKLFSVPPVSFLALGAAMQNGADKYGLYNWRDSEVTASVFYDAMLRHLLDWREGQDHAPDSGIHHLAHLMAGAAIIIDAQAQGVFIDDRKGNPEKAPVYHPENWRYIADGDFQ